MKNSSAVSAIMAALASSRSVFPAKPYKNCNYRVLIKDNNCNHLGMSVQFWDVLLLIPSCLIADYCYTWFVSPVADLGFPRGGGANPKGGPPTYYLANFFRKLHENEEILGQRGGARVPRAPP